MKKLGLKVWFKKIFLCMEIVFFTRNSDFRWFLGGFEAQIKVTNDLNYKEISLFSKKERKFVVFLKTRRKK